MEFLFRFPLSSYMYMCVYVHVCMRVGACVGVHYTRVSVCYFFRTVNCMKHLEIPLHILVLESKSENILMPFK